MPSTYTGNLGIELPADGELDGVWGDVVNDNMNIIDRAVNGSLALALSGTSSTLTTSDGSLSDGQYKLLVLGGSPSGTHTITIAPSDAQKIYFVRNTTAQSVVFTQGSGGNVTVATGDSAIIYSDGAGAGAAVVNITNDFAMSSVKITGGTIDGTAIGGTSAAAGSFTTATATTGNITTVNATTVDTTNIEVTTLKAKDGTSAGSIADSTGVVTLASSVLTTTDINGGTIDGTVIGGSSAAAGTFTTVAASGVASFADGSAAAPSITNTGDTNTGIFFPAADTIAFTEGGVESMRIDSSGNVGIGTTTPSVPLSVVGDITGTRNLGLGTVGVDATCYLSQYRSTVETIWGPLTTRALFGTASNHDLAIQTNNTERMRIAAGGNVGIGTTSPTGNLTIGGSSPRLDFLETGGSAGFDNTTLIRDADVFAIQTRNVGTFVSNDYRISTNASGALTHEWRIANTERMRIDSTGNVGIGTVSPTSLGTGITTLELKGNSASQTDRAGGINFMRYDGNPGMYVYHADDASYISSLSTYPLLIQTNGFERMRIDASGNVSISTSSSPNTLVSTTTIVGIGFSEAGYGVFVRDSSTPLYVNRLTNDGALVEFRQAGVSEGNISVSGTTVSYNGGHLSRWAQLPDGSRPELLKGTVMSNLDQMSNWDGEENEQLNCVEISTVEGDANVAGLFVAWDSTEDDYNDILLAMTGDMVIRIAAGVTVARGDLLMAAGDGTAKPQADDIIRAKTIAKVTSNHVSHTYADGSYAVPCVVMAC